MKDTEGTSEVKQKGWEGSWEGDRKEMGLTGRDGAESDEHGEDKETE